VLLQLIARHGPSSESYEIPGRVYKDRWDEARQAGKQFLSDDLIKKAIEAYLTGYETDWRDAYPGINALNLMEQSTPPDPRRLSLNGVVRYAVERRIASEHPDYRDYATLLELALLAGDQASASEPLANVLAALREPWEAENTARNLSLISDSRKEGGESVDWENEIINELESVANPVHS
jgi:hypothetical protein